MIANDTRVVYPVTRGVFAIPSFSPAPIAYRPASGAFVRPEAAMREAGEYDPDTIRTRLVAARMAQVDARKRGDARAMVDTTARLNELLDMLHTLTGTVANG